MSKGNPNFSIYINKLMRSPLSSLIINEYQELMKLFCFEIIGSFALWTLNMLLEGYYSQDNEEENKLEENFAEVKIEPSPVQATDELIGIKTYLNKTICAE